MAIPRKGRAEKKMVGRKLIVPTMMITNIKLPMQIMPIRVKILDG
jgi:hypothetical protein